MPFEEYMERCNRLINLCKVYNEIKELNLPYYPADKQTYDLLGQPGIIMETKDEHGVTRYVIECNKNLCLKLSGLIIDENVETLQSYQSQVLSSILGTLRYYQEGTKTSEEALNDFFAIYLTTLKATQMSMHYLYKEAGFETDEEAFESSMKQIDQSFAAYGSGVEAVDRKMLQIQSLHKQEIAELKRVVQKINKQLGHEIQNVQRAEDSYKAEIALLRKDQQELYRLRDLLFTLEYKNEQEEKENPTFPVHTKDKVCVLGGSPSWITQMKTLLPDFIYLSPDQNVNLDDKLPFAKEVWIQWRAISHAQFNKAMSVISGLDIPIYYFAATSPNRCAIQFLETRRI